MLATPITKNQIPPVVVKIVVMVTLPIPLAANSVTGNEAIMGTTKPAASNIFLRIARREGSTDAYTWSSLSSFIAFLP
jgi:hypothetical protein